MKIKREHEEDEPRPRKVARPNASSTQLEFDESGNVVDRATSSAAVAEPEVIVLD